MSRREQTWIMLAVVADLLRVVVAQCSNATDPCSPPLPCVPGWRLAMPGECGAYQLCIAPYEWARSTEVCGGFNGNFNNATCLCDLMTECTEWECPPPTGTAQPLPDPEPCLVEPTFCTESRRFFVPDRHYCTRYHECTMGVWRSRVCPDSIPYYSNLSPFPPPCGLNIKFCESIPFDECTDFTTTVVTTTVPTSVEVTTPIVQSTSEPSTARATTTEPTSTQLTTSDPSTTDPTSTEPSTTEPTSTEPTSTEQTTTQPSTSAASTAEQRTSRYVTTEHWAGPTSAKRTSPKSSTTVTVTSTAPSTTHPTTSSTPGATSTAEYATTEPPTTTTQGSTVTTTPPTTETIVIFDACRPLPASCDVPGERVAHQEECRRYYECVGGLWAPRNCTDTFFNPYSDKCQTKFFVYCDRRCDTDGLSKLTRNIIIIVVCGVVGLALLIALIVCCVRRPKTISYYYKDLGRVVNVVTTADIPLATGSGGREGADSPSGASLDGVLAESTRTSSSYTLPNTGLTQEEFDRLGSSYNNLSTVGLVDD